MSMPSRLAVISDLERPDHFHLRDTDCCYFWGEYTPYEHTDGRKWNYSSTNQLISNLKKKMDRAGQMDWQYKQRAIEEVAYALSQMWRWDELKAYNPALIPMPPSKSRSDAMYDPRMVQILHSVAKKVGMALDIRDCLSFDVSTGASHETENRPSPERLYQSLSIETASIQRDRRPGVIFIFDDMLTTGAHFIAAARRINEVFPGVQVVGMFVARRRVPNPLDEFDAL